MRMMIWALILALFGPLAAHAQRTFITGTPPDFLDSRVSYANNANDGQTAGEFIADITARLGQCREQWLADITTMAVECLVASERDDLLLVFLLEHYPTMGVSRVNVYDDFQGQAYAVKDILDALPRTQTELDTG